MKSDLRSVGFYVVLGGPNNAGRKILGYARFQLERMGLLRKHDSNFVSCLLKTVTTNSIWCNIVGV